MPYKHIAHVEVLDSCSVPCRIAGDEDLLPAGSYSVVAEFDRGEYPLNVTYLNLGAGYVVKREDLSVRAGVGVRLRYR